MRKARSLLIAFVFALTLRVLADSAADQLMRSGADAFARGDFAAAERDWAGADAAYERAGDAVGRIDARLNLAAFQQQTGKFEIARSTLADLEKFATEKKQTGKLIGVKNAIGVLCTFTRQPEQAETSLNEALALAHDQKNGAAEASIRNNRGNLYASWSDVLKDQGKPDAYAKALDDYANCADLARKFNDESLAAKASSNAALTAARAKQFDKANSLNADAMKSVGGLPDSLEKANLLITIGQTDESLITGGTKSVDVAGLQRRAFDAYEKSAQIARQFNQPVIASYAIGYQGHLYELAKRYDESLTLTRRAVNLAQQVQSPDSLYLWQWQAGRILKDQGKPDEAIEAYARARDTIELGQIRSDLALGYGNRGMKASFRSEVGPLYYQLADLLLARADRTGNDEARVQQYLSDARNTVERLRVGELESYLQDVCTNQAQARRTDLTRDLAKIKSGNPAVVYLIPLSDRIEILLTTRQGMKRFKSSDVGSAELTKVVREFRSFLEKRYSYRYREGAQKLYHWLIEPIDAELKAEGIDTLVFVPDGALRTIPMAALHDGNDFLIARYAVAVSPGLSLSIGESDPQAVSHAASRILASGVSQSTEAGFKPLPNVAVELSSIQQLYKNESTKLLDESFQLDAFTQELASKPAAGDDQYSIVHIASHGVFAPSIADTYVLTFDGKMNLNTLQNLLRPYQLGGKPISLLTLSACQTSAGDDQAALERASLGLGGLAVKAGARSAMASLWCAHDQATGELIAEFYKQLVEHPEAGKAKALQQAQLSLIKRDAFAHPIYWAPFLMIGDWL